MIYRQIAKTQHLKFSVMAFELGNKTNQLTYNINKIFPAASLIKLPLALAIRAHFVDLNQNIAIKTTDYAPGAGVIKTLKPKSLTITKLLELLLTQSDNSAQNVLIRILGKQKFITYLKKLKLKNTTYLPSRSLTTTKDMAALGKKIINDQQLLGYLSNPAPKYLPKKAKYYLKIGRRLDTVSDFIIINSNQSTYIITTIIDWPVSSFNTPENQNRLQALNSLNALAYQHLSA